MNSLPKGDCDRKSAKTGIKHLPQSQHGDTSLTTFNQAILPDNYHSMFLVICYGITQAIPHFFVFLWSCCYPFFSNINFSKRSTSISVRTKKKINWILHWQFGKFNTRQYPRMLDWCGIWVESTIAPIQSMTFKHIYLVFFRNI